MRLCFSLLTVMLLSVRCEAAEIDFNTILTAQDGKPKQECVRVNSVDRTKCDEEITVTLRWISKIALDLPEEKLLYSDIIKRGKLNQKLDSTLDKIDISIDEAKLLKDQIIKLNYSTILRFKAIDLIDPTGVKDAK